MRKIFYSLIALLFLSACANEKVANVLVSNPTDFDRNNEIVELNLENIKLAKGETFVVLNNQNEQVAYQILSDGNKVLFLADVEAGKTATYTIKKGTPKEFKHLVYGRFVPERKDDFTWENDKVAYRLYGPALEENGQVIHGIDYWTKRTEDLIIDKWYRDGIAKVKSFHEDHGEGLDFYNVGPTLGIGAAAPFIDEKIVYGKNFTEYKVIENGPLRFSAEFKYAPYSIGKSDVTETRIVTLDAHANINKVVEIFEGSDESFPLVAGIAARDEEEKITLLEDKVIAYQEPKNEEHGIVYGGAIYTKGFVESKIADGHVVGVMNYENKPVTYFFAGGWSEYGFSSFEEWTNYLKQEKDKLENPLKVEVK